MGIQRSGKPKVKPKLTCDICNREFWKSQALSTHRRYAHKIHTISRKTITSLKKKEKKPVRLLRKKVNNTKLTKKSTVMSATKIKPIITPELVSEVSPQKKVNKAKKTLFKCPKCVRIFSSYFPAYKHIQKCHCVDENDQSVEPNSPFLIKPICVEANEICVLPTSSQDKQITTEKAAERYMCLGCQKTFDELKLFEDHVKVFHANGVESLFFPNNAEFGAWKTELEAATKTKFLSRTSEKKTKEIYHCSHQASVESIKTLLCPGSLSITDYKNGLQVFYYKEHFGHSHSDLSGVKFKKYNIAPFLKGTDIKSVDTDKNLYEQFKIIMSGITENAANINISILNNLLGKALEMTILLNSSVQDDEHPAIKKNMTDDQITEVLAEHKSYPGKRKADNSNKVNKKIKPEMENNENSKMNSMLNTPVPKPADLLPRTPLQRSVVQSPSFNDTYKHFVDQNCKAEPQKRVPVKKKNVVKTKIGQFKPNTSPKEPTTVPLPKLSPKKPKQMQPTMPKIEIQSRTPKNSPLTPNTVKTTPKTIKNTPLTTTSVKTIPKATEVTPLSPIRPKPTPSKPTPSKPTPSKPITSKPINFKLKPDIKYEVKEQENDCNILILKI